jgi:hypothetical protein
MFGAIGGDNDDYQALQDCLTFAKENNKTVLFTQDYKTSKSIVIENKGSWIPYGINIDGNNKVIIITENVPCLIVRGNGHRLQNLTVQYDMKFFNEVTCEESYTSSLIQLQAKAENTVFLCGRNKFTNVVCQSANEYKDGTKHYKSVGFEIVIEGNNSQYCNAYNNVFVGCHCFNLGTAIKVVQNQYSQGCNGNQFDIAAWAVECYLDGITGGCTYAGLVQSSLLKYDAEGNILNKYLCKNLGDYNTFNNMFYDCNYDTNNVTRPMISDGSGKFNTYTRCTLSLSTETSLYNAYNLIGRASGNLILPINPTNSSEIPISTYLPLANSFNAIKNASISVSANISTIPQAYWGSKYTEAEFENGLPKDVAPVFHDDSVGRRLGYFTSDGNEGTIDIEFVPLGVMPVIWVYLGGYTHPAKVELITEYSNGRTVTREFDLVKSGYGNFAFLSDNSVDKITTPTKAIIRVTHNTQDGLYISQICGYMYTNEDGII